MTVCRLTPFDRCRCRRLGQVEQRFHHCVLPRVWDEHQHIHHPDDARPVERHDFTPLVVGGRKEALRTSRKGSPTRYIYRRACGRRYGWHVDIPTPEGRLRAGPFATPEEAIEARDVQLAKAGRSIDAAGDAPDDIRPTPAPLRSPERAMIFNSTLPSQVAALAGRFIHAEVGSLDGPVKLTVHMTRDLLLIGLNVEPVPAVAVAVPPARPRKRRPEFEHPA
jgi:hypothetical protein